MDPIGMVYIRSTFVYSRAWWWRAEAPKHVAKIKIKYEGKSENKVPYFIVPGRCLFIQLLLLLLCGKIG
jgi:hypothetical protein